MSEPVQNRPFDFYASLGKRTPEEEARKYFQEIELQWIKFDDMSKQLSGRLDATKFNIDINEEESLQDVLDDVYNRIPRVYEIMDEHRARIIPMAHRVILEGRLLMILEDIRRRITEILDDIDNIRKSKDLMNNKYQMLTYEKQITGEKIQTLHMCFLKSFLNQDW